MRNDDPGARPHCATCRCGPRPAPMLAAEAEPEHEWTFSYNTATQNSATNPAPIITTVTFPAHRASDTMQGSAAT